METFGHSAGDGNKITISDLMWKIGCIMLKLNIKLLTASRYFVWRDVFFAAAAASVRNDKDDACSLFRPQNLMGINNGFIVKSTWI